jgi:hypothetical protein
MAEEGQLNAILESYISLLQKLFSPTQDLMVANQNIHHLLQE